MTTIRNIILLLAVLNGIFGAEGVADMTHNGFSLSPLENRINFIIPDYQLKENTIGGVDYLKPEIEGAGSIAQPGQPDLPSVSTYYMVEPGKTFDVQYTIEDYEVIDNIDLLPFSGWDNNQNPTDDKSEVYVNDSPFPNEIVQISEPIVFRDVSMVQVTLTPFQFNPVANTLKVIKNVLFAK